jgi:hypothetical protein
MLRAKRAPSAFGPLPLMLAVCRAQEGRQGAISGRAGEKGSSVLKVLQNRLRREAVMAGW